MKRVHWLGGTAGGVAAACAVALGAGVALAGNDMVVLKSRQSLPRVAVLRDGCDVIEIDENDDGKKDRDIPTADVDSITFGDAPVSFRQGDVFLRQGRYEDAIESLEKSLQDKEVRAFWIQPHANYLIAECRRRLAANDPSAYPTARETYAVALAKAPNGRLAPAAVRGTGLCFLGEGRPAEARAEFEKLTAEKFGAAWALRGRALKTRALAAEDKMADALALCDDLAKTSPADLGRDAADEVLVARTEVLVKAKKFTEARALYQKMADEAGPRDAAAKGQSYNGIGDCYLAEGKTREALLAYLRVHVLYFKADDEWARALYGAARCFIVLKEPARAKELVTVLEKEHPNSPWTEKAKKELGG